MELVVLTFYYFVAGLTAWYLGSRVGKWLKEQMSKHQKIEINTRKDKEDNG